MEATLIQKLVNELHCKSCSSQMEPPLFQCSDGHLYCVKCPNKSGICSECEKPVTTKRNLLFEKLFFRSVLKCSFSVGGCKFTEIATVVAKHEKCCPFSPSKHDSKDRILQRKSEKPYYSETRGHSLEKLFIDELECPVCIKTISLPMGECHNGHLVCQQCFSRLKLCPVCRGPKSQTTNVAVELLYNMVEMPCYYAEEGCLFRGKVSSVPEHVQSCSFVQKVCPLMFNNMCTWQGFETDLVNHCMSVHYDVISLTAERRWVPNTFLSNRNCTFHYDLFYIHDVLFRCVWEKVDNKVWFSVNILVDEKGTGNYHYKITVFSPVKNEVLFVMRDVCTFIQDGSVKFLNSCFTSLDLLLRYCDEDYNLSFEVEIFKG